jgi:hypothetical protein
MEFVMRRWNLLAAALCLILPALAPSALSAQNLNCTIIVPDAPLTAAGLATPYQLQATDPNDGNGPCDETNSNSSAFAQAAIFDPATGQISIYNPLVVTSGAEPARPLVVPALPPHAIVALWFGFNGNNLTQQGAHAGVLDASGCVNGLPGSIFGQFSYCNAPAFFKAANLAIRSGRLHVPRLGFAHDGLPCPTVRDFYVVDQDQSDNLPVTYLISAGGQLAQNTQKNMHDLTNPTVLGNPSDNGLLDRFMDPALGCMPWKVADLADPGQTVPGLALNELQAKVHQGFPVARIPAGDPMALNSDGSTNLAKVNAYRRGVDQREVRYSWQASTAQYCRNMLRIAPARLLLDEAALRAGKSPVTSAADSLFTFLAQRFTASYDILGCGDLVHIADPISITVDGNGVAIRAEINLRLYDWCKRYLRLYEREDDNEDARAADATE